MEEVLPVHPREQRSATVMLNEFKNRASGVVEDRLPSQYAVPRNELMPTQHERMLMQGSTLYRKRTRKPKVDLLENPACADRQLTDAYESMRINRNPALYRPTKADISKSTSLLDQFEKNLADADVNTLKLKVLESVGAHEAALQINREIHEGSILRQPIDKTLAAESIPNFNTYTKGSTITNGHGPTYGQSHAPKIFNPLTSDLTRKSSSLSHGSSSSHDNLGMTVAQLKDLLKQSPQKNNKKSSSSRRNSNISHDNEGNFSERGPPSLLNKTDSFISDINYDINNINIDSPNNNRNNNKNKKYNINQPKWDSSFASESYIYETSKGSLPHPGVSILARDSAMDDTFREKILKSRALAAGTLLLDRDLCIDRQKLDREDFAISAAGHIRIQDKLNKDLSPRREFQRNEINWLINDRKERDNKASRRVAKYELEETLSRIPKPKALVIGNHTSSKNKSSWNSSYILNDPGY